MTSQAYQKSSWIENLPWLYCVKCRSHPSSETGRERSPFFVTDCGHIHCRHCKVLAESSQCFMCQRKGPKFLEITEDIRSHPQVGIFFQDLSDVCIQLSKLFKFQHCHKTLGTPLFLKDDLDEASLVAQFGLLGTAPVAQLEKQNSESAKRRKLLTQRLRAICTEKTQQLEEIEAIVMKLKSLGYREEDILDIRTANGDPVPSVKTICETRTCLQRAAKVLGARDCRTTTTPTDAGVMQAGRRADGGQGGVQSTAHGSQFCVAGMVAPQQQQLPHGSVAQTVTPHQFGLTPFQRVETPSQGSVSTPTVTPVKKMLVPPPPPPPFPPHLSQAPPTLPINQGSPMSWDASTRVVEMPPPRLPPSRKDVSLSPSPQLSSQRIGRQFLSSQTPQRQHQLLTPQQTSTPAVARASLSPVPHPNLSSPVATGVATGSAMGLQLTPTQCTTPTNQLIRNVSHQSLQRIMRATPSPVEMMTPKSNQSTLSRPRTPMSVQSASPSPCLGTPKGTHIPTYSGRVSIRGPPSGGRMGRVTAKILTPEGTPQHKCALPRRAATLLL